jgi:cbb3-type cytochrome c oxidase subunit III
MIGRGSEAVGRPRQAGRAAVTAVLLAGVLASLLGGCNQLFPQRSPGEQLYVDNCADCHGIDGRGNTAQEMGQPYADLIDDVWKNGGDDGSLANSIRDGSFGLMPGFQQKLTEPQIQALVAYIKVLRKRGGAGAP